MSAPVKPIVRTGILTEFGMVTDEKDLFNDPTGASGDLTYVPGFSDMRREHDLAKARGETPTPLPVNLRWVRRTRLTGQPDNTRLIQVGNQGYKPVSAEQVGKEAWIKAMPPGSDKLPDGTVGNLDWVLMVTDGKRAAKNAASKTVKFLEQNTASLPQALEQAGLRVPGSNPEVSTELAGPRR
jgi:hypothetical protein